MSSTNGLAGFKKCRHFLRMIIDSVAAAVHASEFYERVSRVQKTFTFFAYDYRFRCGGYAPVSFTNGLAGFKKCWRFLRMIIDSFAAAVRASEFYERVSRGSKNAGIFCV